MCVVGESLVWVERVYNSQNENGNLWVRMGRRYVILECCAHRE